MNLHYYSNLKALNEEESRKCNGGSVLTTIIKKVFPPIIIPVPTPDGDNRL
jgi:hypothetical protein